MQEVPAELVDYLERRAGDSLRTVSAYDREGVEFEYVRGDIDREQLEERAAPVLEEVLMGSAADGVVEAHIGRRYASMHLRERALIINIPVGAGEGVGITLEPEAGRNLTTFVKRCEELVHGRER